MNTSLHKFFLISNSFYNSPHREKIIHILLSYSGRVFLFMVLWVDLEMLYKVRAKIIEENLSMFYEKLIDGTIYNQRPDGKEIVASMKRAKLIKSGVVEWFENCGCSIPLQHERETQYDYYFSDITTEIVDESGKIDGKSFWSYMEKNNPT